MRRLANVEYEDAAPEIQAVYDEIMEISGTPDVWNMLKMFGHNEMALRAMWGMLHYTVLEGELPALLKQLVLFNISVKYGNDYCTSLHGQHHPAHGSHHCLRRAGDHGQQSPI